MNTNSNRSTGQSLLDSVRSGLAGSPSKPEDTKSQGREPSNFWLNIGLTIPGAGEPDEDGNPTDLFISLPNGLPLDDMKPQAIKGSNQKWIQLLQAKNGLLEAIQTQAASLEPGERAAIPTLSVEIYRRAEPQQIAAPADNSLVASMLTVLHGGKEG